MPNRIIKESIHTSKKLSMLSDFAFRLWTNLITYVDDYGRGIADPLIIKGAAFPRRREVSEEDVLRAMDELAAAGLIRTYSVDGENYFYFPSWSEHQRIQTKRSKYPDPKLSNGKSTVTHRDSPPESNPIQSESNPNPNSISRVTRERFEKFWEKYPKKTRKEPTLRTFSRLDMTDELFDTIMSSLDWQIKSRQWTQDNGRFIPSPQSWILGSRWNDQPTEDDKKLLGSFDTDEFFELAVRKSMGDKAADAVLCMSQGD